MNIISVLLNIIYIAAPLLVVTMGALVSEYAGRMAMFLEYLINMGAFFCYAFMLLSHNVVFACFASVLLCAAIVFVLERIASRFNANMFLISLAMNLLFASFTTFFSVQIFKTRGVLYSEYFLFNAPKTRIITSIFCYFIAIVEILVLKYTRPGLIMRITGSDSQVLSSQGISADKYRCISWIVASASGAFAGCVLALRLSGYVPGMSGGRGWTALAAVFLGKKRPLVVALSVIVFAFCEFASTHLQNIQLFTNIPSAILLALPYLVSLILIAFVPQEK